MCIRDRVTGARQTSGVSVNVTGFDNTRTAGMLSFTFYDSAGNVIAPGAIGYDSKAAFSSYFAGSDDGGPVSYTHLDVYKRQETDRERWGTALRYR